MQAVESDWFLLSSHQPLALPAPSTAVRKKFLQHLQGKHTASPALLHPRQAGDIAKDILNRAISSTATGIFSGPDEAKPRKLRYPCEQHSFRAGVHPKVDAWSLMAISI